MRRLSERKIVLVKRQTRLEGLVMRFNTVGQARFYVEHLGADFSDYEEEHAEYVRVLREAEDDLSDCGRVQVVDRSLVPNFHFAPDDIVVAVGQDGLVANTLKYLTGQPLLGVNPSPTRWDGILLPFRAKDLKAVVPEVLQGGRPRKEVSLAVARLNDGQTLLAVNDLFIGQKTHTSARYRLKFGEKSERHSSSGVIVSTGMGSTGWFASILAGAGVIAGNLTGRPTVIHPKSPMEWDAEHLYFSVREPFPSNATGISLCFGKITRDRPLKIESNMAENGVIFSDGVESDFLDFNSGMEAEIGLAERKGMLVA